MDGGIYKIVNTLNGKCYVGSAAYLIKRKRVHWSSLRLNKHHSRYLQQAWNKYGEEAFEFRIVGKCSIENLVWLEQEAIDHLHPEYNIAPTARSCLGVKHTLESRHNMGESKKGITQSVETRTKHSLAMKGKRNALGSIRSVGTRDKMSKAMVGNQNARGSIRSVETRVKMSKAQLGNQKARSCIRSGETRAKLSKPWSAARRAAENLRRASNS